MTRAVTGQGTPGGKASTVADGAIRGALPKPTSFQRFGVLQRKCGCEGPGSTFGECSKCKTERGAPLQRANAFGAPQGREPNEVPPIVHEVLRSPGQPLDASTRAFMEPRFGQDFSGVRVHADAKAAEAATSIDARAFTSNRKVVFGAGEFAPQSEIGRRLLSHELTHVIQQESGVYLADGIGSVNDQQERQADETAASVGGGSMPNRRDDRKTDRTTGERPNSTIQRQPIPPTATPDAGAPKAEALPTADELATRIAQCIGIWETNRGKDAPSPKESSLDTIAGVHASMATIEQATMPYAITALKGHKELRDKATPPLTMKELNEAETRCTAVVTLLGSVTTASTAGTKPDDFIKANTDAITATGLSNADVKTMFSAVTLKSTIDTARDTIEKKKKPDEKKKALQDAIDAIPAADRLGLGEGSLKAYINKATNWGENRAGWQRKAVAAMANDVGTRIESVATSDSGTALAIPVIKSRVNIELAKTPVPSKEDIVKTVAQQNNPNEANYGTHVWDNYARLYP